MKPKTPSLTLRIRSVSAPRTAAFSPSPQHRFRIPLPPLRHPVAIRRCCARYVSLLHIDPHFSPSRTSTEMLVIPGPITGSASNPRTPELRFVLTRLNQARNTMPSERTQERTQPVPFHLDHVGTDHDHHSRVVAFRHSQSGTTAIRTQSGVIAQRARATAARRPRTFANPQKLRPISEVRSAAGI